ncbi:hypothetical protein ON05_010580 [Acaryochloris sp. CCMEE 5410]|nr:hypothetical protein ON05_010580 [Acaryochloris sp. CCMEE 5410]
METYQTFCIVRAIATDQTTPSKRYSLPVCSLDEILTAIRLALTIAEISVGQRSLSYSGRWASIDASLGTGHAQRLES